MCLRITSTLRLVRCSTRTLRAIGQIDTWNAPTELLNVSTLFVILLSALNTEIWATFSCALGWALKSACIACSQDLVGFGESPDCRNKIVGTSQACSLALATDFELAVEIAIWVGNFVLFARPQFPHQSPKRATSQGRGNPFFGLGPLWLAHSQCHYAESALVGCFGWKITCEKQEWMHVSSSMNPSSTNRERV